MFDAKNEKHRRRSSPDATNTHLTDPYAFETSGQNTIKQSKEL